MSQGPARAAMCHFCSNVLSTNPRGKSNIDICAVCGSFVHNRWIRANDYVACCDNLCISEVECTKAPNTVISMADICSAASMVGHELLNTAASLSASLPHGDEMNFSLTEDVSLAPALVSMTTRSTTVLTPPTLRTPLLSHAVSYRLRLYLQLSHLKLLRITPLLISFRKTWPLFFGILRILSLRSLTLCAR